MTSAPPFVTLASRITRSDDVLFQEMAGEAVLLDLASEQYFGLNQVGTRIWELLGEYATLAPIIDALTSEFDADRDRLSADLIALLTDLLAAGLVKAD